LNTAGYVIVGVFVLMWAVALAVWRFGHLEERWGPAAFAARAGP
jgi:high-affinity nickel-transport protein